MVSTSGSHKHEWPAEHLYPSEAAMRSGNTGPWDAPPLGDVAGVNPGGVPRWGIDNFQVFPNLEILIYERNWYLSDRFWPTSNNTHVFEADLWFVPVTTARERLAREYAAVTVKEYALLRWFLLHPAEVHSAERLLEHVWDEHADPFTNTVRMTLSNLRRKLAATGATPPIVTLPGRGYMLEAS